MSDHPERFYGGRDLHFVTFSCYQRRPFLDDPLRRDLFLTTLEQVRRRYRLVVIGYVVMLEHVHLLVSEYRWYLNREQCPVKIEDTDILVMTVRTGPVNPFDIDEVDS